MFSWSMDLSARISAMVKEDSPISYKHVVLVLIGSISDQPSIFLGSRCLWNENTDSFISVRFQNQTLYAVVLIYALYYE